MHCKPPCRLVNTQVQAPPHQPGADSERPRRSQGTEASFGNQTLKVRALDNYDFSDTDICLMSAGGAVSKEWSPRIAAQGCVVIDNSSSMDQEIAGVVTNISVSFANILEDSGLDYQIILLSAHGPPGVDPPGPADDLICIPMPLLPPTRRSMASSALPSPLSWTYIGPLAP